MAANPKSKTRNQKSVVLGVTGSIAAYKSAEMASLLVKQHQQRLCCHDCRRDGIHHAVNVANAFEKSGD
jgi:hypothetical protein